MDKEFYDKYGKELDCKSCIGLQECSTNSNIPLCDKGYRRFAKDKIADLETELAEKDTRIAELEDKDWYEACIKQLEEQNNRLIDTLKEKDKEINSLIVDYEKRISQEQELMSNMEHRLTEKQNTIDEINKEFVQSVKDWKTLCAEKDKEISKLQASYQQVKTQLAIQELEKAKASADKWFDYWENSKYEGNRYDKLDVSNAYLQMSCEIEEQIKKLRGENEEV